MAFRLVGEPKVILATKALATKYANMRTIVNDRALREHRLAHYRKEWAAGEFTPVNWATCHCLETDLNYRVNGKHTSVLLCELDEIPKFYVILMHFEADTMQDVVSLYTKFDPGIAAKNTGDTNQVYAGSIPELANIPQRIITACVSGINYAMNHERAWVPLPEGRAKVLPENVGFVVWADEMLGGQYSTVGKPLRRCGVMATIYLTYLRDADDAGEFWPAVRDETGLSPKLPDRMLAKYLLTHRSHTGGGMHSSSASQQATYRAFHVKAIHAWNAWRRGDTTNLNYYPDAPIPPII